jgi:hypothetical protein
MNFRRFAVWMLAIVALTSGAFLYISNPAHGSDHQDSPAVVAQPGADITDLYVFPSPHNPYNIVLAMDIHPLIPAGMSQNVSLDPGVLYQFKLSHGNLGTKAPADTAFQFIAHGNGANQTISMFDERGAPLSGPSTLGHPLGTFALNARRTELDDGIVAYAGPRADPFFFDLFQFFSILPDRNYSNPRTGDKLGSSTPTFNGFAAGSTSGPGAGNYPCSTTASTNALTQINGGFDVVSIVVEIPKYLLANRQQSPLIHVWATTGTPVMRLRNGAMAYNQIELLARPAVKELFEVFADHAKTNVHEPYDDRSIAFAIGHFMAKVAGRSAAISNVIESVLYPNELAADLSQPGPAAYLGVETGGATGSKFGGRGLIDDAIDISLGAVFGNTIPALGLAPDDGKENLCLAAEHVTSGQGGVQTQDTFPYLATPH